MYDDLSLSYAQPLEEGTVAFKRFHLYLPLGSGSSAVVWEAQDLTSGRRVALKILHTPEHIPATSFRAQLEARALQSINHPNIVQAVDFGVFEGGHWIAMELVEGPTLRDAVIARAHELNSEAVFALGRPLLHALTAVHAAGFVHRDLKPSNIILRNGDWSDPVLLDFGVVRTDDTPFTKATTKGRRVGTVLYMAPELVQGGRATFSTDVFAAGVILYELATLTRAWLRRGHDGGLVPIDDTESTREPINSMLEVIRRINTEDLPAPDAIRPEIPRELSKLIRRATAPEPKTRFDSVEAFLTQLERITPTTIAASIRPDTLTGPSNMTADDLRTLHTIPESEQDSKEPLPYTKTVQARRAVILTLASLVVAATTVLLYSVRSPATPPPAADDAQPRPVVQRPVPRPVAHPIATTMDSTATVPPSTPSTFIEARNPPTAATQRADAPRKAATSRHRSARSKSRPSLSRAEVLRRRFLANPPQNDRQRQAWDERVILLAEETAAPATLSRIERLLKSGRLVGDNGGIEAALGLLCRARLP